MYVVVVSSIHVCKVYKKLTCVVVAGVSSIRDRNNDIVKSLRYAVVSTSDSHSIVRVNAVEQKVAPESERDKLYQFFDEQYLSIVAQSIGWPRDRGVVELIPIVVGIGVVG